jgi:type I pantothenate kinase
MLHTLHHTHRARPDVSPYRMFTREEWAKLRADTPMTLSDDDLLKLSGVNERVSAEEVVDIYLPMSRLLNFYVHAAQSLHSDTSKFLGRRENKVPFIIGMAGSVAVGKSTTARVLRALLARWLKFMADVKAGQPNVTAPVYSHFDYDIRPGAGITVDRPDILIVEGLNVLQPATLPKDGEAIPFVSDFFDFSIYIHAEAEITEDWYVNRFLTLRETAFRDPAAYFHRYASLSDDEARSTALGIWRRINLKNLEENILPTRQRAALILDKGADHAIERVWLRKL